MIPQLRSGVLAVTGLAAACAVWSHVIAHGTLAAHQDVESIAATASPGMWNMEVAALGSATYAEANSVATAVLSAPSPGSLAPGNSAYGGVNARVALGRVKAGTLSWLTPVTSGDANLLSSLTYGVKQSTNGACSETVFTTGTGVVLVPQGTAITATGAGTVGLPAATSSAPGTPILLCFKVTLSASTPYAARGTSATVTWRAQGSAT